MPKPIESESDIKPGEICEDTFYHPCLCVGVGDGSVWGISLIDGSHPRSASIEMSGVRKLSLEEAWRWKFYGPADEKLAQKFRWWEGGSYPPPPDRD